MEKIKVHLQKNLFFGSIIVLMYVCFIHVAFYYELKAQFLRVVLEMVTIPVFIASVVIPVWVIYLMFTQKVAYLTLLISFVSIAIIGYSMF